MPGGAQPRPTPGLTSLSLIPKERTCSPSTAATTLAAQHVPQNFPSEPIQLVEAKKDQRSAPAHNRPRGTCVPIAWLGRSCLSECFLWILLLKARAHPPRSPRAGPGGRESLPVSRRCKKTKNYVFISPRICTHAKKNNAKLRPALRTRRQGKSIVACIYQK